MRTIKSLDSKTKIWTDQEKQEIIKRIGREMKRGPATQTEVGVHRGRECKIYQNLSDGDRVMGMHRTKKFIAVSIYLIEPDNKASR